MRPHRYSPMASFDVEDERPFELAAAEVLRYEAEPLSRFKCNEAGIYALYYTGPDVGLPVYSSPGALWPVYLGESTRLGFRLSEHFGTLTKVHKYSLRHGTPLLKPSDFMCKLLILHPLYRKGLEEYLIQYFDPWWNRPELPGFGNSGTPRVGKKGEDKRAAVWDVIFPGRPEALERLRPSEAGAAVERVLLRKAMEDQDQSLTHRNRNREAEAAHALDSHLVGMGSPTSPPPVLNPVSRGPVKVRRLPAMESASSKEIEKFTEDLFFK